jgi:hypothetical protein
MQKRFITFSCLLIASVFALASCGSGGGNIKILTPTDGTKNPYSTLLTKQRGALFFRFWELRPNFTGLDGPNIIGVSTWYPDLNSEGIAPGDEQFDIEGIGLEKGKFYKVELWGNYDYSIPCDSVLTCAAYGYGDCAFALGAGQLSDINICFAYSGDTTSTCSGFRQFTSCPR